MISFKLVSPLRMMAIKMWPFVKRDSNSTAESLDYQNQLGGLAEITGQKHSVWIHFNGLWIPTVTQTGTLLLEAGKIKKTHQVSLMRWIRSCCKLAPFKKSHQWSSGAPRLPCAPTRSSLQNKFNVVLAEFTQLWSILHIPVDMLLLFLELQPESQQSQRRLYAGLSSNCQLIKGGKMPFSSANSYVHTTLGSRLIWMPQFKNKKHLPILLIVTGLSGAVQPIWICYHQRAVDKHLKGARVHCASL